MKSIDTTGTRDWYGETLLRIARNDKNVVAMDCDLGRSTRSYKITEADPKRFIEMGIAEQDMISTAAGMASMGKVVFVNSFAVFVTGRAFDQIRQQIALPEMNVKICGSSAGITQGPDGATHQSVLDVALMRSVPNMVVMIPADGKETEQAVYSAYEYEGPVYIRLSRYPVGNFLPEGIRFEIGKGNILVEGEGIVCVSCGPVLRNVMEAASLLSNHGINVGVINCPVLKPFDRQMIGELASRYRCIVSIEEHSVYGGLGSAVAEVMAETNDLKSRARLVRLGVQDTFGESGTAEEVLHKHGLDTEGIRDSLLEIYKNTIG